MPRYQIDGMVLTLSAEGGSRWRAAGSSPPPPPPPPPPSGAVTPALTLSYLDGDGVRHRTPVIDGVTTITGPAPFSVTFDAGGSLSTASDANTADLAFVNLKYLFNFGENRGTTWATTGRPTDTERGGPVAGYTFETVGTHQPAVQVTNSLGQQSTITCTVVVTALGAGTDMTPDVLPAFVNGGVYNAPAGGTWPNIGSHLNGLHNVTIRKVGSGADPYFPEVNLESRNEPDGTVTRTRGIRFLGCDVGKVTCGNLGFDYCSFTNGWVRCVELPTWYSAAEQAYSNRDTRTPDQGRNVRTPRGLFLQSTGVLGQPAGSDYVMFVDGLQELHLRGVTLRKTTGGQHILRGVLYRSSIRNCIEEATGETPTSINKLQGWDCTLGLSLPSNTGTPDEWPEDDTVVAFNPVAPGGDGKPNRMLGLPSWMVCWSDCILGPAGTSQPTTNFGVGPENNIPDQPAQGAGRIAVDHCYSGFTTPWYEPSATGKAIRFDYRYGGPDGTQFTVAEGTHQPLRVPAGWDGPYFTGVRP